MDNRRRRRHGGPHRGERQEPLVRLHRRHRHPRNGIRLRQPRRRPLLSASRPQRFRGQRRANPHLSRGVAHGCRKTGVAMSSIRPLSGITVIEIGHSVAAPYAGMILGELGAEVIKVENPKGGDACRGWGPPFAEGAATCFHAVNRGKKGIAIDLADPEDAARLKALILERADVVIHNLKFGALDKYGLSAATLIAEKPSLVCCNLNAFGAVGPLRDRPGYDPMMQAYR